MDVDFAVVAELRGELVVARAWCTVVVDVVDEGSAEGVADAAAD